MGTLDGIIDTISVVHPLIPLIGLLKNHGKLVMVGAPEKPLELPVFPLLMGRKLIARSGIGGIKETQEMINFAAKDNITADIELCTKLALTSWSPASNVEAQDRVLELGRDRSYVVDCAQVMESSKEDFERSYFFPVHRWVQILKPGQSVTATQLKEMNTIEDENAPKARKPYTISKQQERWTEEKHKKFLKAWRRLEEHVGTKTTVQIRSHAQKFFSKVYCPSYSTCFYHRYFKWSETMMSHSVNNNIHLFQVPRRRVLVVDREPNPEAGTRETRDEAVENIEGENSDMHTEGENTTMRTELEIPIRRSQGQDENTVTMNICSRAEEVGRDGTLVVREHRSLEPDQVEVVENIVVTALPLVPFVEVVDQVTLSAEPALMSEFEDVHFGFESLLEEIREGELSDDDLFVEETPYFSDRTEG
ncbi:hypothetical protein IFM89_010474, partial [Coptis chinensis]